MSSGGTSKPSSIFIRALYLLTNIRASRQFGRFFEYLVGSATADTFHRPLQIGGRLGRLPGGYPL